MRNQGPTRRQLLFILSFVVSCVGLALFLWTTFGGSVPFQPKPYQVGVKFKQGLQLAQFADVRVSGVNVGKVISVDKEANLTTATLKIDPEFVPIPADTKASLRTKTLLGETFVNLSFGARGDGKPTIPDGGSINNEGISEVSQLDEILDAFTPLIREDARSLIQNLHAAGDGLGPSMNSAAGDSAQLIKNSLSLTEIFARNEDAVKTGTQGFAQIASSLGQRSGSVQQIIRSSRQLTDVTAKMTSEFKELMTALPATMRESRQLLEAAEVASSSARPALAALKSVLPRLRSTGDSLTGLAPNLRSMFVEAKGLPAGFSTSLPIYTKMFDSVVPLTNSLVTTGGDLTSAFMYTVNFQREGHLAFSNAGNLLNSYSPNAKGEQKSMLRVVAPLNAEIAFGQSVKNQKTRSNPYPLPGSLDGVGSQQISFSCSHANNGNNGKLLQSLIAFEDAHPCVEQQPWSYQGVTQMYPHVQRASGENMLQSYPPGQTPSTDKFKPREERPGSPGAPSR